MSLSPSLSTFCFAASKPSRSSRSVTKSSAIAKRNINLNSMFWARTWLIWQRLWCYFLWGPYFHVKIGHHQNSWPVRNLLSSHSTSFYLIVTEDGQSPRRKKGRKGANFLQRFSTLMLVGRKKQELNRYVAMTSRRQRFARRVNVAPSYFLHRRSCCCLGLEY